MRSLILYALWTALLGAACALAVGWSMTFLVFYARIHGLHVPNWLVPATFAAAGGAATQLVMGKVKTRHLQLQMEQRDG